MPIILWLIARPKVIAGVALAALLAYAGLLLYNSGQQRERLRQQESTIRTIDGALKGAAEAHRELNKRPVDDLMREKGWLRDQD